MGLNPHTKNAGSFSLHALRHQLQAFVLRSSSIHAKIFLANSPSFLCMLFYQTTLTGIHKTGENHVFPNTLDKRCACNMTVKQEYILFKRLWNGKTATICFYYIIYQYFQILLSFQGYRFYQCISAPIFHRDMNHMLISCSH